MAGIVYYANYLKYIERARSDWVRGLGLDQLRMREAGLVFAVRRIEADYLRPARFDDDLLVRTGVGSVGAARLVLRQEVWRGSDLLFSAVVTLICLAAGGRAVRLPEILRNLGQAEGI